MDNGFPSVEKRFFSYVTKLPNGCWEWVGNKLTTGYGRIRVGKKALRAHRVSWEMHKGPIPANMNVLHSCDNPGCVNPEHLFIGTQLDNMVDMERKGRSGRSWRNKS